MRRAGRVNYAGLLVSTSGTPGPVSISIPVDVADSKLSKSLRHQFSIRCPRLREDRHAQECVNAATISRRPRSSPKRKDRFSSSAGMPGPCPASELGKVVRSLGIPTFTNGHARGVIPDDGEVCFGFANPYSMQPSRKSRPPPFLNVGQALTITLEPSWHPTFGLSRSAETLLNWNRPHTDFALVVDTPLLWARLRSIEQDC